MILDGICGQKNCQSIKHKCLFVVQVFGPYEVLPEPYRTENGIRILDYFLMVDIVTRPSSSLCGKAWSDTGWRWRRWSRHLVWRHI